MSTGARRYHLLGTLGRGGFGTVYRAELVGAGGFTRPCALKLLNAGLDAPEEVVERLRDEARVLGLIDHPAVVKVDDLARFDIGWAVVMEYVAGIDLSAVVAHGALHPKVALRIVEEVAGALHTAWASPSPVTGEPLRIVHRDIKPSNIRLTPNGVVKLLDFGVARAEFAKREAVTSHMRMGSLRYMSPERIDGIDGPPGDIYALGLVLAELVAGQRFPEPPKHPRRHEEFLEDLLQATPSELHALLTDMLAFEPAARPSARKVRDRVRDLAEATEGPSLRAWAEQTVAGLEPTAGAVELSTSELVERVEPGAVPPPAPTTAGYAPWQVAIAFVASFGVVLAVALVLRPEPTPEPAPAPVPTAGKTKKATPKKPKATPKRKTPSKASKDKTPPPEPPVRPKQKRLAPAAVPAPEPQQLGGRLHYTGDALSVRVMTDGGPIPLGRDPVTVPPGKWPIKAVFSRDAGEIGAGSVDVTAGSAIGLSCSSILVRCGVR